MLNKEPPQESIDPILYERIEKIAALLQNHHQELQNAANNEERIILLQAIALVEDVEISEADAQLIVKNDFSNNTHSLFSTEAKQIAFKAAVDAGLMYYLPNIYASQNITKAAALCLAPVMSPMWANAMIFTASIGAWCFAPSYVPSALGKSLLNEGFERCGSSLYVIAPLASGLLFHYGNKTLKKCSLPVEKAINPDTPEKPAL